MKRIYFNLIIFLFLLVPPLQQDRSYLLNDPLYLRVLPRICLNTRLNRTHPDFHLTMFCQPLLILTQRHLSIHIRRLHIIRGSAKQVMKHHTRRQHKQLLPLELPDLPDLSIDQRPKRPELSVRPLCQSRLLDECQTRLELCHVVSQLHLTRLRQGANQRRVQNKNVHQAPHETPEEPCEEGAGRESGNKLGLETTDLLIQGHDIRTE